jgi:hypothetical protein
VGCRAWEWDGHESSQKGSRSRDSSQRRRQQRRGRGGRRAAQRVLALPGMEQPRSAVEVQAPLLAVHAVLAAVLLAWAAAAVVAQLWRRWRLAAVGRRAVKGRGSRRQGQHHWGFRGSSGSRWISLIGRRGVGRGRRAMLTCKTWGPSQRTPRPGPFKVCHNAEWCSCQDSCMHWSHSICPGCLHMNSLPHKLKGVLHNALDTPRALQRTQN